MTEDVGGAAGSSDGVDPAAQLRGTDVLAALVLGMLVPAATMVAWMLGLHALGAGTSVVFAGVAVFGVLGLVLLRSWLRFRGLTAADIGFTALRRSPWHLVWVTPVVITASGVAAAAAGHATGTTRSTDAGSSVAGLHLAWPAMALVTVTLVLLAPLVEETVFRAVVHGWLRRRVGALPTIVLTGVVFGLCHISPEIMLYVVPFGICLTAVRAWCRSAWASVAVHAANNAVISVVVLTAVS